MMMSRNLKNLSGDIGLVKKSAGLASVLMRGIGGRGSGVSADGPAFRTRASGARLPAFRTRFYTQNYTITSM